MYSRILVPLDGSELAECVLSHVQTIIRGCREPEVIFIRVVEPVNLPVGALSAGGMVYSEEDAARTRGQIDSEHRHVADEYLKRITGRREFTGTSTRAVVVTGKPAEAIADYAGENGVDLIVIGTHGRSGISRWVMGSTADKVLHAAPMPVLMIRSAACGQGS